MRTFQDFEKLGNDESKKREFIYAAIAEYKLSPFYKDAADAYEYFKHKNVTINQYQKWLYALTGERIPDSTAPNHKCASNFFWLFVIQQNDYLLGNGVSFKKRTTKDKLGGEAFDNKLQRLGEAALWGGVSYGFYNYDRIDVFDALEFVPLWDEETGELKAGIRFWQLDPQKPMRVTFYEIDGYTNYKYSNGKGEITQEKISYINTYVKSDVGGEEIRDGYNNKSFPIVPLWANSEKQSEFTGMRSEIDCYDLILSGFANDLDEASEIYWIIQNAAGMDEVDVQKFRDRIKRIHTVWDENGQAQVSAHTMEVPYNARETALTRLSVELFINYGALNTRELAAGSVTATAIKAAYENLRMKSSRYENCVTEFINGILALAEITDEAPSYTPNTVVNQSEQIAIVLQSADYLSEEYVTRKLLTFLGDIDQYETVMKERAAAAMSRMMSDGGAV